MVFLLQEMLANGSSNSSLLSQAAANVVLIPQVQPAIATAATTVATTTTTTTGAHGSFTDASLAQDSLITNTDVTVLAVLLVLVLQATVICWFGWTARFRLDALLGMWHQKEVASETRKCFPASFPDPTFIKPYSASVMPLDLAETDLNWQAFCATDQTPNEEQCIDLLATT
jgi:hypothetical protein